MENKKPEELFAQGCGYLNAKLKKYDDTKCYDVVKNNVPKAIECFNQAAELGYAPAMREVARGYIEGYGVMFRTKSKTIKGIHYLRMAVLAGDKNAMDYCLEHEGYLTQFVESEAYEDLKAINDYYEAKERGEIPQNSTETSENESDKSENESRNRDSDKKDNQNEFDKKLDQIWNEDTSVKQKLIKIWEAEKEEMKKILNEPDPKQDLRDAEWEKTKQDFKDAMQEFKHIWKKDKGAK